MSKFHVARIDNSGSIVFQSVEAAAGRPGNAGNASAFVGIVAASVATSIVVDDALPTIVVVL